MLPQCNCTDCGLRLLKHHQRYSVIVNGYEHKFCSDSCKRHYVDEEGLDVLGKGAGMTNKEERFRRLATTWKSEIGPSLSITEMAMHPAYQQIIGMGQDAVPLILKELDREAHHWFWALKAITGEDPVPPESRGNINEMRSAWLRWGQEGEETPNGDVVFKPRKREKKKVSVTLRYAGRRKPLADPDPWS